MGDGLVEPFPYREDVSVGLYLMELARHGTVRVVPQQRKFQMPLDFTEHCAEGGSGALLVLHRFRLEDAQRLWQQIQARRNGLADQASASALGTINFCSCVSSGQE